MRQHNIRMLVVSICVRPTRYLYTLSLAVIFDVTSLMQDDTRSMKASAAVANSNSEPEEIAASI
jgi:hypothetical protein